jgi:hypothetical protein
MKVQTNRRALFHVKQRAVNEWLISAIKNGRGERIRTSGPCLPKALLLASRIDLRRLSLRARYALMGHVPARFTPKGSRRASDPCAYPCGDFDG